MVLHKLPLMLLPKRIKQSGTYRKASNILYSSTSLVLAIKITSFHPGCVLYHLVMAAKKVAQTHKVLFLCIDK